MNARKTGLNFNCSSWHTPVVEIMIRQRPILIPLGSKTSPKLNARQNADKTCFAKWDLKTLPAVHARTKITNIKTGCATSGNTSYFL